MLSSASAKSIALTPATPKNTSFASLKTNQRRRSLHRDGGARSPRWAAGDPAAPGLPLPYPRVRGRRPAVGKARHRVIVHYHRGYGSPRSFLGRYVPQCPAVDLRRRCRQPDGRAQDPEGDHRRFRYRIANGRGSLESSGLTASRRWCSSAATRSPTYRRTSCRHRRKPNMAFGISGIFPRTRKLLGYTHTPTISIARHVDPLAEMAVQRRDIRSDGGLVQES